MQAHRTGQLRIQPHADAIATFSPSLEIFASIDLCLIPFIDFLLASFWCIHPSVFAARCWQCWNSSFYAGLSACQVFTCVDRDVHTRFHLYNGQLERSSKSPAIGHSLLLRPDFLKPENGKSSFLSDHLKYNMEKMLLMSKHAVCQRGMVFRHAAFKLSMDIILNQKLQFVVDLQNINETNWSLKPK